MLTDFLFLLLFLRAASAVIVPPPTNVTVSCRNLETTVSWTYSDQQPQTRFHVKIQGSDGHYENETTEHQYDLSHYVWQSHLHYMDYNCVTVAAIQEGDKSQPVAAPSFTFNSVKKAHVTCALDFPPVNVVAEKTKTVITFHNPFHFYTELKESEKHDHAFFQFTVVSVQGEFTSDCKLEQLICRYELPSSDDQEKCVTLKGRLDYGNNVEHVVFKETDRICATDSGAHVVVIAVLLAVVVLIVCVATISICTVKAWTMKPVPKPTVLSLVLPSPGERYVHFFQAREEIHPVTVQPRTRPVGEDGDRQGSGEGEGGGGYGGGSGNANSGSRGSGHVSGSMDLHSFAKSFYSDGRCLEDSNQDLEAVGLMSTGHGTDEDSVDDSVKTECFSIEEEEPITEPLPHYEQSHYDRRHAL